MSCEHVTAYWMICLQLLLHPSVADNIIIGSFFIRIHELWTCYCLLDDLPPIIIASLGSGQYIYWKFFIRIHELWTCYCLLDDLPPIIIASPGSEQYIVGSFLSASVSCEYVTAYWMICLQLLLHPLVANNIIIGSFFIGIHELWICYCLLDDLPPIIITSSVANNIIIGSFLSASMSCEYVTAYWMIYLQLLLHPLGSEQYNYQEVFYSHP